MNEAMRESAIAYSTLGDLPFSEMAFMAVNTASMGPVISKGHSSFFKREEYDHNHFSEHLRACIGIDELAVETLVVICQLTDQKIECYGYVYLKDFQIIPVKFTSTAHFDAWIRALSEDMDQSEDILLTIENRSFGVSHVVGPDAFAEPAAFLQKHAPRLYRHEAEQIIKQQYLEDFRLLDSMKQEIDLAETKQLWQRFIALSESAQGHSGVVAESFGDWICASG
jgi:hypothetical protein